MNLQSKNERRITSFLVFVFSCEKNYFSRFLLIYYGNPNSSVGSELEFYSLVQRFHFYLLYKFMTLSHCSVGMNKREHSSIEALLFYLKTCKSLKKTLLSLVFITKNSISVGERFCGTVIYSTYCNWQHWKSYMLLINSLKILGLQVWCSCKIITNYKCRQWLRNLRGWCSYEVGAFMDNMVSTFGSHKNERKGPCHCICDQVKDRQDRAGSTIVTELVLFD